MVYSYDLFGQIAISLDDIELYLNSLPNFTNSTSSLRRQNYADNYPLSTIITRLKLNGEWENLLTNENTMPQRINTFATRYVKSDAEKLLEQNAPCPSNYHICTNRNCVIYKRRLRTARNARYQAKVKLKVVKAKKLEQRKIRETLAIEVKKQLIRA